MQNFQILLGSDKKWNTFNTQKRRIRNLLAGNNVCHLDRTVPDRTYLLNALQSEQAAGKHPDIDFTARLSIYFGRK